MSNKSQFCQSAQLRKLTLDLYNQCLTRKQTIDSALAAHPTANRYNPQDRAFIILRLKTAFRYRGAFIAIIRDFSKKVTGDQAVLHLALTELLCLKTPIYAVANWTKSVSKPFVHKYIHALLQHSLRLGDIDTYLTPENILPQWLLQLMQQQYDPATIKAIVATHLMTPPLDITVLDNQIIDTDHPIVPWSRRYHDRINVQTIDGYSDGKWWVQDVSASLAVMLLPNVKNQTILEIGAAPGGKTMQLCTLGAKVTAVDYSPERIITLKDNLQRTKLHADIICADALILETSQLFDIVVLDAPCSATGTIRRHPELPWIRDDNYLKNIQQNQIDLLNRAISLTKNGGTIMYITCSLLRCEGQDVIETVLKTRHDCLLHTIQKQDTMLPDFFFKNGYLQTNPSQVDKGMDGFFVACLVKKA